jgi:thymidine phosphorylase
LTLSVLAKSLFRKWRSLDDKRICILCEQVITVLSDEHGPNFEVLQVIDSLQLTRSTKRLLQSTGSLGEDIIIAGSVSDQARRRYTEGWKAPKPYIRVVPHPRNYSAKTGAHFN